MRSRCVSAALAVLLASFLIASLAGCAGPSASSDNPTLYPGNPLNPAKEASAAAGTANEKANEIQNQVNDLNGGTK